MGLNSWLELCLSLSWYITLSKSLSVWSQISSYLSNVTAFWCSTHIILNNALPWRNSNIIVATHQNDILNYVVLPLSAMTMPFLITMSIELWIFNWCHCRQLHGKSKCHFWSCEEQNHLDSSSMYVILSYLPLVRLSLVTNAQLDYVWWININI